MNSIQQANEIAKSICGAGYRYLYGAKGQPYTKDLVTRLAAANPGVFTASLKALAMQDADKGYTAIDCSGFVCTVLGVKAAGSAQIRSAAVARLPVTKENAREGMAIWKNGHIAYIGEGLKIYEAAGTASDMKVSSFEKRAGAFKELLIIKGSALAMAAGATQPVKGRNPYRQPDEVLKIESTGESVKWLQWELREAGYKIAIDGDFGPKTLKAVIAFQQSCKIEDDGTIGPITRSYLIAA